MYKSLFERTRSKLGCKCLKWQKLSMNLIQILTCTYSLKKVQEVKFLIFLRDHPFSTYAKFPEKLIFLPLIRTHACTCQEYVCVSGGKNVSFSENFAYLLNGWSIIDIVKPTKNIRNLMTQNKNQNILHTWKLLI